MLREFIAMHEEQIVQRCRAKVAERRFPPESESGLVKGMPLFLSQLTRQLSAAPSSDDSIGEGAARYGRHLERQGFTVDQVVHVYGNVCQAVTDLAVELKAQIPNADFRALNRCLDDAIAEAVVGFGDQRDEDISAQQDASADERLARFVDQQEVLLEKATCALEAVRSGAVGIGGSTGHVLAHSLEEMRALSDRTLSELRFTAHTLSPNTKSD